MKLAVSTLALTAILIDSVPALAQGFNRPVDVFKGNCELLVDILTGPVADDEVAAYLTGAIDGIMASLPQPEIFPQRFVDMCAANPNLAMWTAIQFAVDPSLPIGPLTN